MSYAPSSRFAPPRIDALIVDDPMKPERMGDTPEAQRALNDWFDSWVMASRRQAEPVTPTEPENRAARRRRRALTRRARR